MSEIELPPLPEPKAARWVFQHSNGWLGGNDVRAPSMHFTAEQMQAYASEAAALERERCAKVCEAVYAEEQQEPVCYGFASECAAAIRAG